MTTSYLASESAPAMRRELAALTLKVACPLVWHDRTEGWPKQLNGGTCFFLRFAERTVGVTANHVVAAFKDSSRANPNLVCQLRTSGAFDLVGSLIDTHDELDIATFAVPDGLADQIERVAISCGPDWPPPRIEEGFALQICGFPENLRTTTASRTAEFGAWGALASVDAVTSDNIIVTYDPTRDAPSAWAPELPELGLNLSGCSGGPVLACLMKNGLLRWYPVAMIVGGPRDRGQGDAEKFDMICLRRIDRISPDGSIARLDNVGWLPR